MNELVLNEFASITVCPWPEMDSNGIQAPIVCEVKCGKHNSFDWLQFLATQYIFGHPRVWRDDFHVMEDVRTSIQSAKPSKMPTYCSRLAVPEETIDCWISTDFKWNTTFLFGPPPRPHPRPLFQSPELQGVSQLLEGTVSVHSTYTLPIKTVVNCCMSSPLSHIPSSLSHSIIKSIKNAKMKLQECMELSWSCCYCNNRMAKCASGDPRKKLIWNIVHPAALPRLTGGSHSIKGSVKQR